ncbi:hypothetical protein ACO0OE_003585 [Hanseniaspora uvarum]
MMNPHDSKISSTRSRPSCCVFVASLSLKLNDKILLETVKENFEKYGDIKLIKVLRDAKNRPYAFVQYFNTEDANLAVQNSKGVILNNRPCRVEKAKVNRTLFLKQLKLSSLLSTGDIKPKRSNVENLIVDFVKHGEIEQIVSMDNFINLVKENKIEQPKNNVKELIKEHVDIFQTNPFGSLNDNCWFLQFAFREDAITAHALYQNIKNDYVVHWAENIDLSDGLEKDCNLVYKFQDLINKETNIAPTSNNLATKNNVNLEIDVYSIFVGQLTQTCTQDMLFDKFSIHGAITNLKLFTKNPNNCYAFITFEDNRSAGSAIETENHTYFNNKSIHVQYRELQHDNAETKKTNSRSYYKNNYNASGKACTQQKNYERNGKYNNFGYKQQNNLNYQRNDPLAKDGYYKNQRNDPLAKDGYYQNQQNKLNSTRNNYSPSQTAPYNYNQIYNQDMSMPMMYSYSNPSSETFSSMNNMNNNLNPNGIHQSASRSTTGSSLGTLYSGSSSSSNSVMSNSGMYNSSNPSIYANSNYDNSNMDYPNVYNPEEKGSVKNMVNTLYNDNGQNMYSNYYSQ